MPKRADHQLEQLAQAALAIQEQEALEAGAIGYYHRVMCQISMPAKAVHDNEFEHEVGRIHISMMAPRRIGIPWGIYPRGIISFIVSDVVRRKNSGEDTRIVHLGKSLTEFIGRISGSQLSGGATGNIGRFKKQLLSTCASRIMWWSGSEEVAQYRAMEIAPKGNIFWKPNMIEQPGLFASQIELGEMFHEDILAHAVPVDTRALKGLWPSCLALDVYTWATFRAYTMQKAGRRTLDLNWEALRRQFGPQYVDLKHFKPRFRQAMTKVKLVYAGFDYEEKGTGVCFKMREPSVRRIFVVNGRRHLVSTHK